MCLKQTLYVYFIFLWWCKMFCFYFLYFNLYLNWTHSNNSLVLIFLYCWTCVKCSFLMSSVFVPPLIMSVWLWSICSYTISCSFLSPLWGLASWDQPIWHHYVFPFCRYLPLNHFTHLSLYLPSSHSYTLNQIPFVFICSHTQTFHIQWRILFSFHSSIHTISSFSAYVDLPYSITLCTQTYDFPISLEK